MVSPYFLGILSASISALVWGGGDFCGGQAARKNHPIQVLALSAFSGIVLLAVIELWLGEPFPRFPDILWAALAGVSGSIGIACLYRALSIGNAAAVAPTAAVVGAILPALFNLFVQGPPAPQQLIGFIIGFIGIWLVTQPTKREKTISLQGVPLAVLAGIGFGGFFILIAQVGPGEIFFRLIIARSVGFCLALVLLWMLKIPLTSLNANPTALLAGVLDAGGNIFFVLATRFIRLDVAAVISSFYPVTTVLLSFVILKEEIFRQQWLGTALCILAIALITF